MGRDIRRFGRDARPVTYSALTAWQTTRRARIDNLVELYRLTCGLGTASHAEQVLWALVLRLAAEFQGFTRDLHDEAAEDVARRLLPDTPSGTLLLVQSLILQRAIDRGNATSATLAADFNRFGLEFWQDLNKRWPGGGEWRANLDSLNRCRNAVAHDRPIAVVDLVRQGWRADLAGMERWRISLDNLATAMDHIVSDRVDAILSDLGAGRN